MLLVLKQWAYVFRGAGLTNYAREALEILATWSAELPEPLQKNLERAWFVNRWGKKGRFIAADLYIEHLNRFSQGIVPATQSYSSSVKSHYLSLACLPGRRFWCHYRQHQEEGLGMR